MLDLSTAACCGIDFEATDFFSSTVERFGFSPLINVRDDSVPRSVLSGGQEYIASRPPAVPSRPLPKK